MAGELGPVEAPTGKFVYAVIHRGSAATVRDVVAGAWDTFTDADIADYDVQLTEQGTASGSYRGDAPSGLNLTTEGHIAKLYYRDNSSVAIGDTLLGSQRIGLTEANVAAISGDATAADNAETAFDGGSYNVGGGSIVAASVTGAVGSVTGAVGSVTGAVGSVTGNVGGNVTGSVGSVTAGVTLANDAITAAKFDESTAFPLTASDSGSTAVARTGADSDTLETLSDEIAALQGTANSILEDTDEIGTNGAGLSALASATDLGSLITTVGVAGAGLTEAGGTGDHLSAVPDTSGTTTLLGRLTATRAGYLDNLSAGAVATASKLLKYIRLLARKDAGATIDDITELNEINANSGNGVGAYSNGTDSQEALRDRGDASWVTGPTASAIADAVLDEALSGHTTAGTLGKAVSDVLEDTGTTLPATLSSMAGATFDTSTDSLEAIRNRGDSAWPTATGFSTHSAADVRTEMDANSTKLASIDGKTTNLPASPAAVGSAMTLTTAYDVYHADILLTVDEANTRDEYTITWFKNGVAVTSGITSPTLQVVKRADGTDLIASTTPTQIGSTGSYKHDESSGRITAGEATLVIAGATIDGSPRSFRLLVGRDSSA